MLVQVLATPPFCPKTMRNIVFAKGRNNGGNGPVDISKDTPLIHSDRGAGLEEQSNGDQTNNSAGVTGTVQGRVIGVDICREGLEMFSANPQPLLPLLGEDATGGSANDGEEPQQHGYPCIPLSIPC